MVTSVDGTGAVEVGAAVAVVLGAADAGDAAEVVAPALAVAGASAVVAAVVPGLLAPVGAPEAPGLGVEDCELDADWVVLLFGPMNR